MSLLSNLSLRFKDEIYRIPLSQEEIRKTNREVKAENK